MIIMMMVILMLLMMMIARHGQADNLHGERCRRSCSDLDNCAGELPPLLHDPQAASPCWRESECVKGILAKERVLGNSSGLTTSRSGDKKTESPHHGNGLGALGLLLLLKESDLVASVVTELEGVGEQAA